MAMPIEENPYASPMLSGVTDDELPRHISTSARVALFGLLSTGLFGAAITVSQYDAPHHTYSLILALTASASAIQSLIAAADFVNLDESRMYQGMIDRQTSW